MGTLTEGPQRLLPLFEPVYEALAAYSQQQPLWHTDETPWQGFATVEGKAGVRYLWVLHSAEVVVFVLAAGRARATGRTVGPDASGILVVDRYKAYKAIEQVQSVNSTYSTTRGCRCGIRCRVRGGRRMVAAGGDHAG